MWASIATRTSLCSWPRRHCWCGSCKLGPPRGARRRLMVGEPQVKIPQKNCDFSMTSPVTPGAVSLLVGMNINPRTPTILPISPASAAAKAEKSAQRKREREAAVNNAAADQALQVTSAAPALRASAKKARHDRTQARVAAVQTEQANTKAMPPPPVPGAQARAGSAKPKADAVRIKKKPNEEGRCSPGHPGR